MSELTPIKLRIPRQDLGDFGLFPTSAQGAQEWAQGLPVANTRKVVQQLQQAIGQLNRVAINPDVRFGILEALRPNVQVALTNLSRRFLNQPLVMPVDPRQQAELADHMYGLVSTAYSLVAIHAIRNRDSIREVNPAQLVCSALQRAVHFSGRRILQTLQLYQSVEPNTWLNLHQLYALAERQQLALLPVADELSGGSTISSAYLQPLLLACCKTNQLRQSDLAAIFRALGEWSEDIRLEDPESGKGMFLINLNSDEAPLYSALMTEFVGSNTRFIDTGDLVVRLEELKDEQRRSRRKEIKIDAETSLPVNLLDHLITCFSSMSMRNFNRSRSTSNLSVGIGLSSVHFHTAGGSTFDEILHNTSYLPAAGERSSSNPFLTQSGQTQSGQTPSGQTPSGQTQSGQTPSGQTQSGQSEDAPEAAQPPVEDPVPGTIAKADSSQQELTMAAILEEGELVRQNPTDRFPIFPVKAVNVSPGGYCLEWASGLPPRLRTGDILCAREADAQDWVIAVVRWISQLREARTLIGVEFLSPRAMAYGARVLHEGSGLPEPMRVLRERGGLSEPMRVLLLPEITLVGQPHTVITPRSGFRERQKLVLLRDGEEFLIELLRQITATATFIQFDFRYIKQMTLSGSGAASEPELPDSAFDSVWTKI